MSDTKIVDDRDINKFRSELRELLNRYSVDNACNTEDFLLADLIIDNLITYKDIVDRKRMLSLPKDQLECGHTYKQHRDFVLNSVNPPVCAMKP